MELLKNVLQSINIAFTDEAFIFRTNYYEKKNIRDGNFFLTISNIFLFLSITNIYKRYIHKYNLRPRLEANTYTHMLYKQTFLK